MGLRPTTKKVNGRWYDINQAADRIAQLEQRVEALEAARFAYASEFDGDKESIHENIRKMKQQVEALKADCRFLLGFAPKDVPTKLDPTFYHTLTYEGDVQLQERVDRIRQATAQQGGEE